MLRFLKTFSKAQIFLMEILFELKQEKYFNTVLFY